MANFIYNHFKHLLATDLATKAIDFDTIDLRVLLVMTSSSADTEDDSQQVGSGAGNGTTTGFSTLDEFDGSGYSAGGVALTGESFAKDATNNRSELDANDAAFGALGNGTRQIQGAVVYAYDASAVSSSVPLAYIDFGSSFNPGGASVTIQWNAEGIIQIA